MVIRLLFVILLFTGNLISIFGQAPNVSDYPESLTSDFSNFTQSVKRLSPDENVGMTFLNQRYTNLLSDISLVNFSGFVRFKTKHQFGLQANSLKEGPFIDKTRAYVHYAYALRVFGETALSLGLSAGMMKIGLEEPGLGAKQAITPDANFDILIHHPKYFLSYTLNQALDASIAPLYTNISLTRFHELRLGYDLEIGLDWKLRLQSHNLIYRDRKNQFGGIALIDYNSAISFGLGMYNLSTFLAQAKLLVTPFDSFQFAFLGSYKQLISKNQFNTYLNTWEVGLIISKINSKTVHEE